MEHAILAIELCFPLVPGDPLRAQLQELIVRQPALMRPGEKWQFYRHAVALLLERLPQAVSGCWDFFDDDARARNDHEMWFNGMHTREGSRRQPSGPGNPQGNDPRFLTFTISLLMDQSAMSVQMLKQACAIPEAMLWRRESFARVLQGIATLSFASVRSDVVYLIPRDDGWGLTAADLREPKFHYLRPIG